MSTEEHSVDTEEIAKHLAVTACSVCRWIEEETSPVHRVGILFRLKPSELDGWVVKRGSGAEMKKRPGKG